MYKVFVYGSLKKGFYNHRLIENFNPTNAIAPCMNLHKGPHYPFAKRGQGDTIGELYEVDKKTLSMLDRLEGHPNFYRREETTVIVDGKLEKAWIYLCETSANMYPKIEDGFWNNN